MRPFFWWILISVPILAIIGKHNGETAFGAILLLGSPFLSIGAYLTFGAISKRWAVTRDKERDDRSPSAKGDHVISQEVDSTNDNRIRYTLRTMLLSVTVVANFIALCQVEGFMEGLGFVACPLLSLLIVCAFFIAIRR